MGYEALVLKCETISLPPVCSTVVLSHSYSVSCSKVRINCNYIFFPSDILYKQDTYLFCHYTQVQWNFAWLLLMWRMCSDWFIFTLSIWQINQIAVTVLPKLLESKCITFIKAKMTRLNCLKDIKIFAHHVAILNEILLFRLHCLPLCVL